MHPILPGMNASFRSRSPVHRIIIQVMMRIDLDETPQEKWTGLDVDVE